MGCVEDRPEGMDRVPGCRFAGIRGASRSAQGKTLMLWSSADPARFQALVATYCTLALFALSLGLMLVLGACLLPQPRASGNQREN